MRVSRNSTGTSHFETMSNNMQRVTLQHSATNCRCASLALVDFCDLHLPEMLLLV